MTPRLERRSPSHGFTVVELVVTIVILGILAAIAIPRFAGRDTFDSRAFFDQATETVRYAQKVSVASRKQVYVCVTTSSITASLAADCSTPLGHPVTGAPLAVSKPSAMSDLTPLNFSFGAPETSPPQTGGQPCTSALPCIGAQITIALPGVPGDPARQIVVERETGYVHN